MFSKNIKVEGFDDELFNAMEGERRRQEEHIELIASENYASPRVFSKEPVEKQDLRGALGNQILGFLKSVSVSDVCNLLIKPVMSKTQVSKTDDSVSRWEPRGA